MPRLLRMGSPKCTSTHPKGTMSPGWYLSMSQTSPTVTRCRSSSAASAIRSSAQQACKRIWRDQPIGISNEYPKPKRRPNSRARSSPLNVSISQPLVPSPNYKARQRLTFIRIRIQPFLDIRQPRLQRTRIHQVTTRMTQMPVRIFLVDLSRNQANTRTQLICSSIVPIIKSALMVPMALSGMLCFTH